MGVRFSLALLESNMLRFVPSTYMNDPSHSACQIDVFDGEELVGTLVLETTTGVKRLKNMTLCVKDWKFIDPIFAGTLESI